MSTTSPPYTGLYLLSFILKTSVGNWLFNEYTAHMVGILCLDLANEYSITYLSLFWFIVEPLPFCIVDKYEQSAIKVLNESMSHTTGKKSVCLYKHKKMVQGAPTDSSLYNFTSNVMWCVILYCLFIHTNSVYEYMIMCFFILINSLITKFSFYCLLLKNVLILAGNLPIQSIAQWWVMSFPPSSFLLIKKHDKFKIFFY